MHNPTRNYTDKDTLHQTLSLGKRYLMVNDDQQDATILAYLFIPSQSVLRVSGGLCPKHV